MAGLLKILLTLLRNTAYANYGQFFAAGGEKERYFKQKSWYNPYPKDASSQLTAIERENIQTIMQLEQQ